jgi:hypothetical protein
MPLAKSDPNKQALQGSRKMGYFKAHRPKKTPRVGRFLKVTGGLEDTRSQTA